jgi:hypothetical protein
MNHVDCGTVLYSGTVFLSVAMITFLPIFLSQFFSNKKDNLLDICQMILSLSFIACCLAWDLPESWEIFTQSTFFNKFIVPVKMLLYVNLSLILVAHHFK